MDQHTALTPKAIQTRQRIFDVAIEQFVQNGYEQTTMRDIAKGADCSPGLAYRYFESKEALVMLLWQNLADDFVEQMAHLETGNWAERYNQAMRTKIEQLQPYRDVIQATIGAVMNPASGVAIVSKETSEYRDRVLDALGDLVIQSTDAPKVLRAKQLAMLMYGIHLMILLVWIYDRSPKQKITEETLSFLHDIMKLLRPLMILPPVMSLLTRLVSIMEGILLTEEHS